MGTKSQLFQVLLSHITRKRALKHTDTLHAIQSSAELGPSVDHFARKGVQKYDQSSCKASIQQNE